MKNKRLTAQPQSYFTGKTAKMLALLSALYAGTLFSFGFAYPWLSCTLYRWEINNTIIDGKRQSFDGKGGELFKNYIKWLFLTLVTLGVYKLWLTRKVNVWKIKHTHFEDSENTVSVYKCKIHEKVSMLIRYYAIIIFTLTLGKCWAECYKTSWTLNHTSIDGWQLGFNGKGKEYFKECALSFLFSLITIGVYALFVPVRLKCWEVERTYLFKI